MTSNKKVNCERTLITKYRDYRLFIRDRWNELKSNNKTLSLESAARKLKTSKSYLTMVMSQKRHITANKIIVLTEILKLNKIEGEYFFFLFLHSTIQEPRLRSYVDSVIKQYQININFVSGFQQNKAAELEVFKEWPRLLLHGLARLKDFDWNPSWLDKRIISGEDRKLMKDSVFKDLLENGILEVKQDKIKAQDFIFLKSRYTQKDFFRSMMSAFLNQAALYLNSDDPILNGPSAAITLPLSKERFEEAILLIKETQKKLIELSSSDPEPEDLYYYTSYMCGLTHKT